MLVLSRRRSFMSSCRAKPCQACILLVVVCVCVCSCVCHSSHNPITQFCCLVLVGAPVPVSLAPTLRATCCTPMAHNVLCTIGFLRKAGGRQAAGCLLVSLSSSRWLGRVRTSPFGSLSPGPLLLHMHVLHTRTILTVV